MALKRIFVTEITSIQINKIPENDSNILVALLSVFLKVFIVVNSLPITPQKLPGGDCHPATQDYYLLTL